MGAVYRARDPRLGRDVAIKVVTGDAGGGTDRGERFAREARAIAALSHPNILAIFDVGTGEMPYLVTELLDGETLRTIVERGPLAPARTVELALQLVAGLGAAHARGIVHRDLKPENVMVTPEGRVKILDFGLASDRRETTASGDASMTRQHTAPGTVLGTAGYMAPEQVRGQRADHRADIFALGAMLYEMTTGRRAFRRDSPADTMTAVLRDPPAALPFAAGTPPGLAAIVRRCLEKDAGLRFPSAHDVGLALEALSQSAAGAAAPPDHLEPRAIAVLPFTNMSTDPANEYFSDGLAEDLLNALSRLPDLRVASRTSSFRYRGRDADLAHVARELGVDTVLEGSVRRSGRRLRIMARLTSTADGYLLWSERYDREMADVVDVQDEIVGAVVGALLPALGAGRVAPPRRPTENLAAYELYLKGRHFWHQRSPVVLGAAIGAFEEAIALDPAYALAYTGLADCYSILRVYGWTPFDHTEPRARDAVTRALSLDPDLPEAHFSQALYTFHFERHWRRARLHFVEALTRAPRVATLEAYFGLFLAAEYAYDEARERIDRAVALDPHSSFVHFLAAAAACVMGDVARVEQHAGRALALSPEGLGARWPLTVALASAGRVEEALVAGEPVVARSRAPMYIGVLGMVYGLAGQLDAARRLGAELDERQGRGEYIVPVARLAIALGLDDRTAIRDALAACTGGGAAPFSVIATARQVIDRIRGDDPEIDRLLLELHDA